MGAESTRVPAVHSWKTPDLDDLFDRYCKNNNDHHIIFLPSYTLLPLAVSNAI